MRKGKVSGAEQVLTYPHPAVKLLNGFTTAAASYLHRDGLASVRAITSAAGGKLEAALYKPFGEQSEWVLPGTAAPETKGWIGERFDADAGLQYLNARYYDPDLSLFLQPDWFEVTKPGVGTNRFSYSHNDPVNKFDPGGNDWNHTNGDEYDPEKTPPVRTKRTHIDDMTDVLRASGRIAYDAGAVAASIALPDFQELTNDDLTWNDALEVASIVPVGKVAKWGVGLIKGAETTAVVTKVADGAVDATRTVCSFDGATLVLAKNGSRRIRDILPGKDLVWGLDADGKGDWHIVQGKTVATYDHKVMVVIRDVETGATQTITSNRIHPYFAQVPVGEVVPPASEGFVYEGPLERGHWIDAGNLQPGYRLLNPDGTLAEVVSVVEQPATLDAWNLTVEDAHSYFVAGEADAAPVWVHNTCFPSAKELGRRFGGMSEAEFHREVKDAIKDDSGDIVKRNGDTNFDVGISDSGSIVLRGNKSGKVIDTGVPATSYGYDYD